MYTQIILTAIEGELKGQEFVFDRRSLLVMGRASDCDLPLPDHFGTISRHHCLLDIDPPTIRVRDLGSLNGTYVNNQPVGCRARGLKAAEVSPLSQNLHTLVDGDLVRVGENVFRVELYPPAPCAAADYSEQGMPSGCHSSYC